MASSNTAAWLSSPKANPLSISAADSYTPSAGEVLVKNSAMAVNPVDNKIQDFNLFELPTPIILGHETAGEVVAVGDGVQNIQVGQRVMGFTPGTATKQPKNGGFQHYSVMPAAMCAPIPSSLPYTSAVVLPIGITTAAAALYNPTHFALPLPSSSPPKHDGTLIIWGGSSSVGLSTLQLARASGIEAFAVAGAHNHELCKSMGAAQVFDQNDEKVVSKIVAALEGKKVVGVYDVIAETATMKQSVEILSQVESAAKLVVVTVAPREEFDKKGVEIRPVFGASIMQTGIAAEIWGKFLPKALEDGTIVAKPDPKVVGKGLENVQKGLDTCKKGYSASKIVVEL